MSLGLNEGSLILRWNCLTSGLHFLIGVYQTRVRGYYSPSIAAILILRDTWCTVEKLTLPSPCPAKIPFFMLQTSTVWCLWSSTCNLLRPVLGLHPLLKLHEQVLHEIEWKLHFVLNHKEFCHCTVPISQRTLCTVGALTVLEGRNMLWG